MVTVRRPHTPNGDAAEAALLVEGMLALHGRACPLLSGAEPALRLPSACIPGGRDGKTDGKDWWSSRLFWGHLA